MISFAPFSRPFAQAFRYGERQVAARKGFLLRKLQNGLPVYAEASPLPGHSRESLEEVERALKNGLRGQLPPSLRFALDSFSVLAGSHPVRSNALLPADGDARTQLEAFRAKGYTHVKLKLFADRWREQLEVLKEFPALYFRLDANLAFTPSALLELVSFLEKNSSLLERIDYLEEPYRGFWQSEEFQNAPLAFASDESGASPEAIRQLLEAPQAPSVFIIKPSVLGGLASIEPLVAHLKSAGKRAVFTSALETEIGRRALLAYLSGSAQEVAGLSTGFLFQENFLPDQACWEKTPSIGEQERQALAALPWESLP